MLRHALLALALISASAAPVVGRAQPTAILQRLASPADHTEAQGRAISSDGKTVVGYSGSSSWFAARWNEGAYQDLGALPGFDFRSEAHGVSGDGSVVVGLSMGASARKRAFRWTAETGLQELPTVQGDFTTSAAYAISDDSEVIVGTATPGQNGFDEACYWTDSGRQYLGTVGNVSGTSVARGVTPDGSVIVGESSSPATFFQRAFRWENGVMESLGFLGGSPGTSVAHAVSADGEVVVGQSQTASNQRAFRWTRQGGMQELPSPVPGVTAAYDISDDGRIIVGMSDVISPDGDACLWIDGQPYSLAEMLKNDYGIDLDALGWISLDDIHSCSDDGRVLTGVGLYWPTPPGPVRAAPYRVVLPRLSNTPPAISSPIAEGSNKIAAVGSTFLATFSGSDLDDDEELTLEVDGLPPGAFMTPVEDTTGPGTPAVPFLATFEWTPQPSDIGTSHAVTISFRDTFGAVASRSFTITARSNAAPTVQALDPETIECTNGQHFVDLSTVVTDADGDPLAVTWKVDGIVRKTQNVASGATVTFGTNYSHGAHSVVVEASDGFAKGSAGTTVAIEDTLDPTIVVAGDAVLTTDPGESFASKTRLTPPTAQDGSGHPVTLTSDAPLQFPLGETIVTWTATDGAGHSATAMQKVTVVDEEKPIIEPALAIRRNCDLRKTYATIDLVPPEVSDNVSGDVTIETTAGSQFAIGIHRVLWTATDAAGNQSQWTQTVTVVNRKPKANAGKNATVSTKSERGVKVVLDGSRSSDPDKHKLKYKWSAKGVRLAGSTTAKPSGTFPVGTTTVKLTVTDVAGAKHTDTMKVTVKILNSRKRSFGAEANRSFAAAAQEAGNSSSIAGSSGLAYASLAVAYGDAAGEFVRWDEGQSEADALLAYAELRLLQKAYGEAAMADLLAAYAETGDESLFAAYGHAARGTAYAAADLAER